MNYSGVGGNVDRGKSLKREAERWSDAEQAFRRRNNSKVNEALSPPPRK